MEYGMKINKLNRRVVVYLKKNHQFLIFHLR